ncbi:Protease synthase and sporulation negative regulatory protein PAI 1 [Mycobacteroides salmoniphilum]|uniref:Protease synthase and sporulation negative regulatory protein PAI 1 n=1 Tax=Mycobacteroides salmoniphilum TaxID=404941 RepID=A0A4R8S4Q0_9MYCO|nr:GNAT family N-acetyltransferase [Mycobacteroides salmoniphilum]TDZ76929.1 Protease synthase and sporulation negative regulatory protein PAI 1 [Mycobacteroides salmoniphilum]TDZ85876.1 Protease synthase and sporulation negative regulatory protein PAI 1 [Mycobacteroides salmoniphilum]TDZ86632.1 Protease synthase and sporulation negative regulatory protein PAI 1 [Mycobacteroides salmoniphilum]
MPIQVRSATAADSAEVAAVAARTFPLACPASSTPENIAAFIAANLSTNNFDQYIREHRVLVARENDAIVGYAMLVDGVAEDPDVQRAVTMRPAMQLSKMYVLPEFHQAGVAGALMTAALTDAAARGATGVWLGVNQENERAQRFYAKHGFNRSGTKTFQVGERVENDYVMQCLVAEPR